MQAKISVAMYYVYVCRPKAYYLCDLIDYFYRCMRWDKIITSYINPVYMYVFSLYKKAFIAFGCNFCCIFVSELQPGFGLVLYSLVSSHAVTENGYMVSNLKLIVSLSWKLCH